MKKEIVLLLMSCLFLSHDCKENDRHLKSTATVENQINKDFSAESDHFIAYKTENPIAVDGKNQEEVWQKSKWYDMNHLWMGSRPESSDFEGRFKIAWDSRQLYLLVEVVDDVWNPTLSNGLENYWKGDYVEVFIDEDQSGGDHKFNHQAFAYHITTEGHTIDQSTDQKPIFLDSHVNVARTSIGNKYLWEISIKLYGKNYDELSDQNVPLDLHAGKMLGFSIAYGDNDGDNEREHFMGSKPTHGINNDEGYINSDVFGSLQLLDE